MRRARPVLGQAGLWATAGTLALAVHLGIGAWLLRQPAAPGWAEGEAMIPVDLVLAPESPVPEADPGPVAEEVVPDPPEAEEPEAEPETLPEPEPEVVPEPEPEPEVVPEPEPERAPELEPEPEPDTAETPPEPEPEIIPDPVPVADPALVLTESLRPRIRPDRPARQQPAPRPEAPARTAPAASRQPAPQPAPQAAAPGGGGGGAPSAAAVQSWQGEAQARISRHMLGTRLPGRRGQVRATLRISVAADGATTAALAASTGDASVDAALQARAARLPRLKPPPGGRPVSLVLPVVVSFR